MDFSSCLGFAIPAAKPIPRTIADSRSPSVRDWVRAVVVKLPRMPMTDPKPKSSSSFGKLIKMLPELVPGLKMILKMIRDTAMAKATRR